MNFSQLNSIGAHATIQTVAGLVIGGTVDELFKHEDIVTNSNVLKVSLETVAQLMLSGVVYVSFLRWATRRGWLSDIDPTRNVAGTIAFFVAQPNLIVRLGNLSSWYRTIFENTFISSMTPSPKNDNSPVQDAPVTSGPSDFLLIQNACRDGSCDNSS